ARRGGKESKQLQDWGTKLAGGLLKKYPGKSSSETPDVVARQKLAAELAGKYKINTLEPALLTLVDAKSEADQEVRVSALRSLLILNADRHALLAGKILKDTVDPQFK